MSKKSGKTETADVPALGRPGNNVKIGIVGVPNVGKSSLFNMLSDLQVPAENYSFCTIDPSTAKVRVPDKRFDFMVNHFKPKSEVPATLTIVDIAGLVRGASEGKGLGNAFLSHISAVDGIFHVVRAFKDKDIEHFEGSVDPVRDLETIAQEFVYKDIERIEKMKPGIEKIIERGIDKTKKFDLEMCNRVLELLKSGKDARSVEWNAKEVDWLNEVLLLSAKPVVYLVNIGTKDYSKQKNKHFIAIKEWVDKRDKGAAVIPFSIPYENKLKFEPETEVIPGEKTRKSALTKIIHAGYAKLGLIHFLTVGEDEVRCWTIKKGTKAKQAAGVIHTDFEKGFQSADVMAYEDFVEFGSQEGVRKAGKFKTQGRDYVVKDGDILHFKASAVTSKKK